MRALLDDPLSRTANYTSAVLVLAILALMVFSHKGSLTANPRLPSGDAMKG